MHFVTFINAWCKVQEKNTIHRKSQRWLSLAPPAADCEDAAALWCSVETIGHAAGRSRTRTVALLDDHGGRDSVRTIQNKGSIWFHTADVSDWLAEIMPFSAAAKARLYSGALTAPEITQLKRGSKIQ